MIRRIAIIGGGAAGASVLSELLSRAVQPPLRLDWYTGGGDAGRGVAYASGSSLPLLNVRAASMGLFSGRPGAFLDFLRRTEPAVAGTDFLPRRRYGDYLQSEVERTVAHGASLGHDVHIIPFAADALVPEADHITVLQGDASRQVDAAVLAVGALPPRPLPTVSDPALASGRYITDAWSLLTGAGGPATAPAHALVIGTGLTAIDVLLELAARWPDTRFTALSRHGLWPAAHLPSVVAPDGDSGEWIASMRDAPEVRTWLRLLREATVQGEWRAVIDSLRPHLPALWQTLAPHERARFLRHVRWLWDRVRHRMPPPVAAAISALEVSGRVRRERGRVSSVDVDGDRLRVRASHAGSTRDLYADCVIQAAGLDTDVRRTTHPLVRQWLTNAHVQPDPLGLGLRADGDGRLLRDERPWPRLFAVGSLLRGTFWESTAMPEIRQQARHNADQLLAD
jgi:uncharacterized NAD(P)/FAD-binding protein YdhS